MDLVSALTSRQVKQPPRFFIQRLKSTKVFSHYFLISRPLCCTDES